ncbi:MAG: dihydrodipicolinate synthase family protein [Chloroflexi bacterium]|nr:dihydrodipicolinate synthase family protein [Chloroflexota bacterium]
MLSLRGIFPPIPTPFRQDESLDLENLKANLARWNDEPLAGYVVAGSNGEAVALSSEERFQLVGAARAAIREDRLLIAGAGAESTRQTIELTEGMRREGADAVIVVTPSYYGPRLDDTALLDHYLKVADASQLPVVLYNVPVYTGLDLPARVVRELATHENIIGIKESGGSIAKMDSMVNGTPAEFQLLSGSASFFLAALVVGAVGVVPALGCLAAERISALLLAYESGNLDTAREIQASLVAPNEAITSKFGIAGLKAALDLIGFYGGPVRAPLQAITQEERAILEDTLAEADLI